MLHPSQSDWAQWQIEAPAHRFFTLRWLELLDPQTFSTWQIRTANIRSILAEMAESGEACRRVYGHHVNLRALLDEAFAIFRSDGIAKRHRPIIEDHLKLLEHLYTTRIKPGPVAHTDEFVRLCHIALSGLSEYGSVIFGSSL